MPQPEYASAFASPLLGPLLIFCLRIVDVSCDTLRVLSAVRGRRAVAGVLGFFQALVWIFAIGGALEHMDSWLHILGYAAGFATGTMVGVTIERGLAYGLAAVRIVSSHGGVEIAEALRERGYGVTEHAGFGREGRVEIVNSVVHRSHLPEITDLVERWDPGAFVTVEEPRILRGGSLARREWRVVGRLGRWSGRTRQRV
jgi:uncharacterized protein YebE (UPF0316 family)